MNNLSLEEVESKLLKKKLGGFRKKMLEKEVQYHKEKINRVSRFSKSNLMFSPRLIKYKINNVPGSPKTLMEIKSERYTMIGSSSPNASQKKDSNMTTNYGTNVFFKGDFKSLKDTIMKENTGKGSENIPENTEYDFKSGFPKSGKEIRQNTAYGRFISKMSDSSYEYLLKKSHMNRVSSNTLIKSAYRYKNSSSAKGSPPKIMSDNIRSVKNEYRNESGIYNVFGNRKPQKSSKDLVAGTVGTPVVTGHEEVGIYQSEDLPASPIQNQRSSHWKRSDTEKFMIGSLKKKRSQKDSCDNQFQAKPHHSKRNSVESKRLFLGPVEPEGVKNMKYELKKQFYLVKSPIKQKDHYQRGFLKSSNANHLHKLQNRKNITSSTFYAHKLYPENEDENPRSMNEIKTPDELKMPENGSAQIKNRSITKGNAILSDPNIDYYGYSYKYKSASKNAEEGIDDPSNSPSRSIQLQSYGNTQFSKTFSGHDINQRNWLNKSSAAENTVFGVNSKYSPMVQNYLIAEKTKTKKSNNRCPTYNTHVQAPANRFSQKNFIKDSKVKNGIKMKLTVNSKPGSLYNSYDYAQANFQGVRMDKSMFAHGIKQQPVRSEYMNHPLELSTEKAQRANSKTNKAQGFLTFF